MLNNIKRSFRLSIINYKALFAWTDTRSYLLKEITSPALRLIFFGILSSYVFNSSNIKDWIIGNIFLLSIVDAIYGVGGDLAHERRQGTLSFLVASPYNKFLLFLFRGIPHMIGASIKVVIGLLLAYLFFGLRISNLPLFFLSLVITTYSAMAIGVTIGSIALYFRDIHLFLNTSEMILMIMTGALFPISRLPLLLRKVSFFIPMRRGIQAGRLITSGDTKVSSLLITELYIGFTSIVIGYLIFSYLEYCSRRDATLDIY